LSRRLIRSSLPLGIPGRETKLRPEFLHVLEAAGDQAAAATKIRTVAAVEPVIQELAQNLVLGNPFNHITRFVGGVRFHFPVSLAGGSMMMKSRHFHWKRNRKRPVGQKAEAGKAQGKDEKDEKDEKGNT
jgi:hypothetical protein